MESRLQLGIIVGHDLEKEEEGDCDARLAHGLSPPIFPSLPFPRQTSVPTPDLAVVEAGLSMDHGCQVRGSVVKGLVARKMHFRGDENIPIGDVRISTSHAVIRHICEDYNPGHFSTFKETLP
jgi:hypothetical protein